MADNSARADAIDLVAAAVNKASVNPHVASITAENRVAITAAIAPTIAGVLVNATNKEPWYQSRVYWGLIIAGVCTVAKPILGEIQIDATQTADIANALATAGQGLGIALSWYGRYRASKLKPLGS